MTGRNTTVEAAVQFLCFTFRFRNYFIVSLDSCYDLSTPVLAFIPLVQNSTKRKLLLSTVLRKQDPLDVMAGCRKGPGKLSVAVTKITISPRRHESIVNNSASAR